MFNGVLIQVFVDDVQGYIDEVVGPLYPTLRANNRGPPSRSLGHGHKPRSAMHIYWEQ